MQAGLLDGFLSLYLGMAVKWTRGRLLEPVTKGGGTSVGESLKVALSRKLIRLENRERKPVVYDPAGRSETDVLRSLLENGTWVRPGNDTGSDGNEK
ncbi:hypothetical protein [Cohnella soli]|uniref:Uncharacterized protein n=1 Tax=Cohnella soli TaxID=425005 RepID=A0ABW0HX01_9BACL